MKLDIHRTAQDKFEIQGQEVTRTYAEGALLAGLLAMAGPNVAKLANVIDQFEAAGLSCRAFPDELIKVQQARAIAQQETDRKAKDVAFFQARQAEMAEQFNPAAIAREKAEKEAHAQRVRDHGARIRSSRSGNGRAFEGYDPSASNWGI
ncbi:hypothetical protein I9018_13920 [Pseudomonas sp. MPFS]|uniref:hypothetical protein n=1 Tax=Pseudomonas sp. MPFS TaxID=2795724 RepID=UPI001F135FAA|nr:hypothetical protein [Pseudomonas sp. MPFS]UMZ14721.1 hypothetical protein I9018_13920 [Pseudomonas sp. MPFS]